MENQQETSSISPKDIKKQQREEYNKKLSAKFYKFFSLLSFLVYYINCTVRIFSRSFSYYESKGVNGFIDWCRLVFDTSNWAEMTSAIFDWYTVTLLVFLVIYAIVFFIIFARFSPKSKKTFKYFKKSFTMARRFLKVINLALTIVVLINSASLTSSKIASRGDKVTFMISILSLLFALIQIAFTIATWIIKRKIKQKFSQAKATADKVNTTASTIGDTVKVVNRYVNHYRSRTPQPELQSDTNENKDILNSQNQEENYMAKDKNNKPKSTISEKLAKIKSRFLRTLAALSLTDKEAKQAMDEQEEMQKNESESEQNTSDSSFNQNTDRFENDYCKNAQEESACDEDGVIEPNEYNVVISVDDEYKERYKKQKAVKRKEDREDIKKKLTNFGEKVDEAGNDIADNIKIMYKKVSSKFKKKNKDNSSENQNQNGSDEGNNNEDIKG